MEVVKTILALALVSGSAWGTGPEHKAPISRRFSEVWAGARGQSLAIAAQRARVEATSQEFERSARHWYPTLGLEAKSFYTDDPGASLFAKLGEKGISGADFAPDNMNYPELRRHEKVTLGARWMFYEGGLRDKSRQAFEQSLLAEKRGEQALVLAEFSKALGLYGGLVVLERKEKAILPLKQILESTLERYQVGSATNPLGYSGLLGLKTLLQRLSGEMGMIQAEKQAIWQTLFITSGIPKEAWSTASPSLDHLFQHDVQSQITTVAGPSYLVQAEYEAAVSATLAAEAERSRYLPHLGLFAQQDMYKPADSNFASSQTYGIFLNWQLFSPMDYGAVSQAKAQALHYKLRAENTQRDQDAKTAQNDIAITALLEQIKLADQSLFLLEEQTMVSRKLFTSGLINALQLTEVYSRRVDVILARSQMEKSVLQMKVESFNYRPYDVSKF